MEIEKIEKNSNSVLTWRKFNDRILLALANSAEVNTERYRSGHNEAVLKTVCPQGRVGSNPTLSASGNRILIFEIRLRRNTQEAEGAPLERE